MKDKIGKVCHLTIDFYGKKLIFTGTIKKVSDTHISFIDKYGMDYCYNLKDVKLIKEVNGNEK